MDDAGRNQNGQSSFQLDQKIYFDCSSISELAKLIMGVSVFIMCRQYMSGGEGSMESR